MRVTIEFDSATTEQVRQLSVALNQVLGDNNLTLGVEGGDYWHGHTPHLNPNQFAAVAARIIKCGGDSLASIVDEVLAERRDHGTVGGKGRRYHVDLWVNSIMPSHGVRDHVGQWAREQWGTNGHATVLVEDAGPALGNDTVSR